MNTQEKMDHLHNSILFNSLLAGDEIRYSDLIGYYIEKFKKNPFEHGCPELPEKTVVYREKKHTDLWITNTIGENPSDSFEIPIILVENKLKFLAIEKQLQDYSSLFIDDFIESYKNVMKKEKGWKSINANRLYEYRNKIESGLMGLKFYLVSPMGGSNITITCDISRINKGVKMEIPMTWSHITYFDLGENLYEQCNGIPDPYLKSFLEDFANILRSISILTNEWQKEINNVSILKVFTVPEVFKAIGLSDLYSKYRASQCAEQLALKLGVTIHSGSHKNLADKTIIANHAFSRKDSLFEVKNKINKDLTVIIQYQNKELRKGVVLKKGTANRYNNWLLDKWAIGGNKIYFKIPNPLEQDDDEKYYKYKVDNENTFYYSKYQIEPYIEVRDILTLMVKHVNDIPIIG